MIYFTSDLHLGHRSIISMKERPFADVDEMNRVLIANYNALVRKNDTVYILGDLSYRIPVEEANKIISELKGRKTLIVGNHDRRYDPGMFDEICDFKTISVAGKNFSLMHYPMLSWPKSHYGSFMLHGHIHSDENYNLQNRSDGVLRYDVGVDANQYSPVSVEQIIRFFEGG